MGTISNAQDLSEMLEVSSPSPAALLPACRHFGQLLSPWGGAGEAANDRASKRRRPWCRFGDPADDRNSLGTRCEEGSIVGALSNLSRGGGPSSVQSSVD